MRFFADYHTHSDISSDSETPMRDMAERAVQVGLTELAVTDHCDMAAPFDEEAHCSAYEKAAQAVEGSLTLLYAIELGEATQDLSRAESILARNDYDFVLGSYHAQSTREDFYLWKSDDRALGMTRLDEYLDDLIELVLWGGFDVLGHLTYPLRYLCGREGLDVSLDPFEEKLRILFGHMAKKGIGMEVNVSGLNSGWGHTMPELHQLRLFRECGGEIVTVGSDAHKPEFVGRSLSDGYALLREAGFSHVAAFSRRKVRYEKLL